MPLVPLKPFATPRRAAAGQVSQLFNNPPPTGGLNLRDPISEMAPTDAIALDNFIARQQGVELRKGWSVSIEPELGASAYVSTFAYNTDDPAERKLFGAVGGDIYELNVDTGEATVSQAATGSDADQWWTIQFSNDTGTSYLLAVSPGAGYWTYDPGSGWVDRTATTTGLPTTVRTVSVWKKRVWFTCENSSIVYYLHDVNAITGVADPFPMGSVLRNGGSVSALINWTIDAGFSVDDYLVVIGTEGDVGVWEGTDPTDAASFGIKGVWYIGPVPRYGVYFTPFGGDVMILSQQGLVPMSKLVAGQWNEAAALTAPASKIQPALTPALTALRDVPSWGVFMVPKESILVIQMPVNEYGTYRQYVMNVITGAWSTFSNMPMVSSAILNGNLYFATNDGGVAHGLYGNFDSDTDTIEGDVQSAFNNYGTPSTLKTFHMARPIFIATDAPSVLVQLNTQYSIQNVPGSPSFTGGDTAKWDESFWNTAVWAGAFNTYQAWVGVNGLGYYGSLRMKVRGYPGTLLTSTHVMSQPGGFM